MMTWNDGSSLYWCGSSVSMSAEAMRRIFAGSAACALSVNAVRSDAIRQRIMTTRNETSLDHFVRAQQERLGNREPGRFGSLEIDNQIKFRELLDCHVASFGAFEDSVDENCRLSQKSQNTGPVGDQAAGAGRFLERGHHPEPMLKSEVREPLSVVIADRIRKCDQRIRTHRVHGRETVLKLRWIRRFDGQQRNTQRVSRGSQASPVGREVGIDGVPKNRHSGSCGHHLLEEFQALGG